MTKEKLDKIIKVARNGGVLVIDKRRLFYNVITENTNTQDIFDYSEKFYDFYILDYNKPLYELKEII